MPRKQNLLDKTRWKPTVEKSVRSQHPALPIPEGGAGVQDVIDLWDRDAVAFARSFDIRDKDLNTREFEPSVPQTLMLEYMRDFNRLQVLKGRQMWVTTIVAIWFLRDCVLRPGIRCCVAAHDDRSAVEVGQFYLGLYESNPLLRMLMPLRQSREHKLRFTNGSQIQFGTANSEFWRGSPTQAAHLTECSFFDDLGKTVASLGDSVPKSGRIVMESTANGEGDFYQMWRDPYSMYERRFLCWLHHHEYRSDDAMPSDLTELESEYIRKHQLLPDQASWYVYKLRTRPPDKRYLFDQEFPASAEVAFILSGSKFLKRQVPLPPAVEVRDHGTSRLLEYDPTHQYVAGLDSSMGNDNGDPQALVILDVTAKAVAVTVEAGMPTPEFKMVARSILAEYRDPLTVIELTGGYGLEMCDYMREMGVPQYRTVQVRGVATTLRAQHGWDTNKETRPILYGGIYDAACGPLASRWQIGCLRLAKNLNALCYDKKGRPQAPSGGHDDLSVAFGLALQGVPQSLPPERRNSDPAQYKSKLQLDWERTLAGDTDGPGELSFGKRVPVTALDFWD